MSVESLIATCPRCGQVDAIFVRSGDDLVCRECAA